METNTNIIIVDNNEKFRKKLKKFIEDKLNYHVIAEASDGNEFLNLPNTH